MRYRQLIRSVSGILLSTLLAAQTRPQTQQQPQNQTKSQAQTQAADQTAVLQGSVMKAGAGQGLKRARVSLRRVNQGQAQPGQPNGAAIQNALQTIDPSGAIVQQIQSVFVGGGITQ